MNRVSRYLFSNFITTFASLFSTLFLIMSIVFFLQIARITSFIEINFDELFKLYLFMLPRILIFTTPIAFFVAVAMSLFRLSKENETIVIFTLGYPTKKIRRFFLFIASILSIFLLFISLYMMPRAEVLKDNFIEYKKTKATLNIKASEFGQKFSDWLVFIEKQHTENNNTVYDNLVLYYPQKDGKDERIILAKSAMLKNLNTRFEMQLLDGKSYTMMKDKWHVTEFKNMTIRTGIKNEIKYVKNVKEYWQYMKTSDKRRKDFSTYVLISLFPLATVLFAISFGVVTYRYEKGVIYAGIFGILFTYFALIMILAKKPIIAIPSVFFLFLITSYIYYGIKIARKY